MGISCSKLGFLFFKKFSKNFAKNFQKASENKKFKLKMQKKDNIKEKERIFFLKSIKRKAFLFFLPFFFPKNSYVFGENKLDETNAFSTKSGLKIIDYSTGDGLTPEWGNLLIINYVMYQLTPNGLDQIDSTFERNQPFLFSHGGGQVIRGIEEAVHGMKIGGKRRIILSEDIGYVTSGLGPVPPFDYQRKKMIRNSTDNSNKNNKLIVFDIELVDIKKNFHKLGNFTGFSFSKSEIQNLFLSK